MKALGCEGVLVTNAAGGIGYGPGTLMAITDHINMTGNNPLIGENLDEFGPRFLTCLMPILRFIAIRHMKWLKNEHQARRWCLYGLNWSNL